MKKLTFSVALWLMGSVVNCAVGRAQDIEGVIAKIDILAIKSLHIRIESSTTYLDITTVIANLNDQPIKMRHWELEFLIGTMTAADINEETLDGGETLGIDQRAEEMLLKPEEQALKRHAEGLNEMIFKVNMGRNDVQVGKLLSLVLNALGNPSEHAPMITIRGTAEMGRYAASHKRWEFQSGGIEWQLKPRLQPRFLLYYGSSQ